MDLTSGYYQAPPSKSSQATTAFITDIATFEWLRVPMGLKGAPSSFFQSEMAQTVLGGLTHHILELYLDDIIVYGTSEDEYVDNLRQVFDRLTKHNVTLYPAKCRRKLSMLAIPSTVRVCRSQRNGETRASSRVPAADNTPRDEAVPRFG